MARTIRLELTLAEAKALLHAAGNTTTDPDAMTSIFPHRSQRDAAWRAAGKLGEGIRAAVGRSAKSNDSQQRRT